MAAAEPGIIDTVVGALALVVTVASLFLESMRRKQNLVDQHIQQLQRQLHESQSQYVSRDQINDLLTPVVSSIKRIEEELRDDAKSRIDIARQLGAISMKLGIYTE